LSQLSALILKTQNSKKKKTEPEDVHILRKYICTISSMTARKDLLTLFYDPQT